MSRHALCLILVLLVGLASGCDSTEPSPQPDPDPQTPTYSPVQLNGTLTYIDVVSGADDPDTVLVRMDLATGQKSEMDLARLGRPSPHCDVQSHLQASLSHQGNRLLTAVSCTGVIAESYLMSSDSDLLGTEVIHGGPGKWIAGAQWGPDTHSVLFAAGRHPYPLYHSEIGPGNSLAQPPVCVSCVRPQFELRGWSWGSTSEFAILAFADTSVTIPSLDVYRVRLHPLRIESQLSSTPIQAHYLNLTTGGAQASFVRISTYTEWSFHLIDVASGDEREIPLPIPSGMRRESIYHQWADDDRHLLVWMRLRTQNGHRASQVGVIDSLDPEFRWTPIEGVNPHRSPSLQIRRSSV